MFKSLAAIVATALLAYAGIALLMYATQSRQIYFPIGPLATTPLAHGMPYEDVRLRTADGVHLHGWYVPAPEARGTLLFFHGNAGNISHRIDSIRIFQELGLSVFIVDYRGYGLSEGRPSEQGTYLDAEAAWRWLRDERGVAAERVLVFGRSLGAAVAARLTAGVAPGGVILESPFSSAPDLAEELLPWLPVRWLIRFDYDNRAAVAAIRAPLLVVHSREDEIIPFHHGRRVFEAASEPKRFLEIRGGHNDGFLLSRVEYVRGLGAFVDEVLR
ncbi:MAG: alpha/beta hydrolase [Rhodocyclaceae bacterium]